MKTVALVSGHWGQNIGNAFFNIGGKCLLERALPSQRVNFIQDQPGYRTFHRQASGNPQNDLELLQYVDVDLIVLQGPMLTVDFPSLWRRTFAKLKERGTKVMLLGAAMFRFTPEEVEVNRRFLKEICPIVFCTRDQPTFDAFHDVVPTAYSGIDSAFFVSDAYRPFPLDLPPYITINYDRFPEPEILVEPDEAGMKAAGGVRFSALGLSWCLHYPRWREALSGRGKVQSYLSLLSDFRKLPDQLDRYMVVRTEHRVNPFVTWKVYRRSNTVASDEPFTYLTVYANTEFTISDRVHACVATLSYGKPAMMYRHTKRAVLFDRLGLHGIGERPMILDPGKLRDEKERELEFIRTALEAS